MTAPVHHLDEAILVDYAAGALREAASALVASHLTLCTFCRRRVRSLEAVGGLLLAEAGPVPLAGDALDRTLARLDCVEAPVAEPPALPPTGPFERVPAPIRRYLARRGKPRWKRGYGGLEQIEIVERRRACARLMRIAGGQAMPRHTHRGTEMMVVLDGGYSDETGHYQLGDVSWGDGAVEHQPVADPEGCLCFIVSTGPVRLVGALSSLINLFIWH